MKIFCRTRKSFIIVLCWGITIICLISVIGIYSPSYEFLIARLTTHEDTKYVLYWTPFWFHRNYKMGFGQKPFENCEYKNCYATNNRTLLPVEQFHAIIFHASTYDESHHGVPKKRLPDQIYIYNNIEAPINQCPNLKKYNSFYNWTMTYRFDSDIVWRHGTVIEEHTNFIMPSEEFVNNKSKIVAWFVSHCKTRSAREDLTKSIQKYVPVDVYGRCGTMKCGKKKDDPVLSAPECYDMLERNYKFYLSLENSYCKDYASEKLYNILPKNVVPVVYGAGDYKISTPPYSVINAADFTSADELASYLKYLDKNTQEYLKYFEWKKTYKVLPLTPACQICKKLHQPIKQSIYRDLHKWWWGENKSICIKEKQLPNIVSNFL